MAETTWTWAGDRAQDRSRTDGWKPDVGGAGAEPRPGNMGPLPSLQP